MIRKPIANGRFYPNKKEELNSLIKELGLVETQSRCRAKGVIMPHAGYPFSGKVAAVTISKIAAVKNIIMLGPNHTGLGEDFSLSNAQSWQTPYGEVKINQILSEKILNAGGCVQKDSLAHKEEHSLEVELPILQYFFKDFQIVPISCKNADRETYQQVASQIREGIKKDLPDTLVLASTDLTHYEPDSIARKKDRKVIESIVDLNPDKLITETEKNHITMCGVAPVAIMLYCLRSSLKKAEVALYETSGDAGGDYNSVVGYVGIILK
ncbi:MAG: AmmeMemoRadiSam system protein B [Candidatus Omnitrophica bacterium]|nr:AmmeMemoRadiSam system protein B [Candidatus Omnitrophota bacterium]MCF7877227.1 AmmeMemoRadiSam system protein B [Candidatus Omnitrophota bacterium]MCF7878066.1 AmmeMemoRadiSam system protein B [Candidatus Omnitrophota bacterium]MCF7892747.1 AmmeMemoRadiSam system protein B [Candidatus Omnitrophota bacterium]